MRKDLILDERQLKEIHHSMFYRDAFAHGTVGHNLLMLIAEMADAIGFDIDEAGFLVFDGKEVGKELKIERTID